MWTAARGGQLGADHDKKILISVHCAVMIRLKVLMKYPRPKLLSKLLIAQQAELNNWLAFLN